MARYRNRYSKEGFYRTMIVSMVMLAGVNFLLLALLTHMRGKSPIAATVIGSALLLRGAVWIFEDRPGLRPMYTFIDMIIVAILLTMVFAWIAFVAHLWLLVAVVLLECVLIIRFYLKHRPRK